MKNTFIKLMAVLLLIVVSSSMMHAQNPDKVREVIGNVMANMQTGTRLSAEMLEKASSVVYYFDNGTPAPKYEHSCYITVTKHSVNVKVYNEYGHKVSYNKSQNISLAEYKKFLKGLVSQDIRKVPSNGNEFADGMSNSSITVKAKKQILFEGDEYVDLSISKGSLRDFFFALLPDSMRKVVLNL